jgi:hypothetical protein
MDEIVIPIPIRPQRSFNVCFKCKRQLKEKSKYAKFLCEHVYCISCSPGMKVCAECNSQRFTYNKWIPIGERNFLKTSLYSSFTYIMPKKPKKQKHSNIRHCLHCKLVIGTRVFKCHHNFCLNCVVRKYKCDICSKSRNSKHPIIKSLNINQKPVNKMNINFIVN